MKVPEYSIAPLTFGGSPLMDGMQIDSLDLMDQLDLKNENPIWPHPSFFSQNRKGNNKIMEMETNHDDSDMLRFNSPRSFASIMSVGTNEVSEATLGFRFRSDDFEA